jgi:hypothetical protein
MKADDINPIQISFDDAFVSKSKAMLAMTNRPDAIDNLYITSASTKSYRTYLGHKIFNTLSFYFTWSDTHENGYAKVEPTIHPDLMLRKDKKTLLAALINRCRSNSKQQTK